LPQRLADNRPVTMHDAPIPAAPAARDFSSADLNRLFDLLDEAPESFDGLDPSVVDGFVCGVLVQPVLVPEEDWIAAMFETEDGAPPPEPARAWLAEVQALVRRRAGALNRAIVEDGWFEPLVFGFDADHPPAMSEYEPLAGLPPVSQAIAPWVEGFLLALDRFPALREQSGDLEKALAPLLRHRIPAEPPAERPAWNADTMMDGFDAELDALVNTVVELADQTMGLRYKVETIRRAEPKVGRNDPCPCGSGKKYKRCHGAE
jgi:uncharacterized protein